MRFSKNEYFITAQFRTCVELQKMIKKECQSSEIVNLINDNGCSLLQTAISGCRFDTALYLLHNGAQVNIVNEYGNEFHFLSPHLGCDGVIELADTLLDMNVSLSETDMHYKNSALFSLCMEAIKRICSEKKVTDFISRCIKRNEVDIDAVNNAGYSVRMIIERGGKDEWKKLINAIQ